MMVFRFGLRCAYRALASADDAATLDESAATANYGSDNINSNSGNNSHNNSNSIITPSKKMPSHQRRTLCILDDPLTALDAETRDHIVQRCILGILRKIPGVAVVVTCGEIDENEGKSPRVL